MIFISFSDKKIVFHKSVKLKYDVTNHRHLPKWTYSLTLPMLSSYRNQSVDLQSKSTDWFLYDGNIGHLKVKASISMRETLENYITKLYQYNFSHKNRVYYLR